MVLCESHIGISAVSPWTELKLFEPSVISFLRCCFQHRKCYEEALEMECTWDPAKISADGSCSTKNLTCGEIDLSKELNTGASLWPEVRSGLPTKSHRQINQKPFPLYRAPPTGSLFLGFPLLCKTTKHCLRRLHRQQKCSRCWGETWKTVYWGIRAWFFWTLRDQILCSEGHTHSSATAPPPVRAQIVCYNRSYSMQCWYRPDKSAVGFFNA